IVDAALAAIAAVLLVLPPRGRVVTGVTAAVAIGSMLLAPGAYAVQTVTTLHTGSIVTAGPSPSLPMQGSHGGPPTASPPGGLLGFGGQGGQGPQGSASAGQRPPGGASPFTSGGGGLLDAGSVSDAVASKLSENADNYTWVAAAVGSQRAAGYQLATQLPVMPIGGFNGSDPSPTLAEFQKLVAQGRIHWFVAGSVGHSNGGSSASSQIAAWVERSFVPVTVDGAAFYDLTS
ncbi:MAG: glycosyl transferase, partial [Pseudolysinimonas sp.]